MKSDPQKNNNTALLESYVSAYRSIHAKSCFTKEELDVVLLSMFQAKDCQHCMDAHSIVSSDLSGFNMDKVDQGDNKNSIPEIRPKALGAFSRVVASRKGYSRVNIEDFFNAGYSEKQLLCVIAIHGILTWNNFFSRIYEEPLRELSRSRGKSATDIKTLEIINLAS